MNVPNVRIILIMTFVLEFATGAGLFAVFRWIAEKNPPAESLQLGLIPALGSIAYFFTCRLTPRLGGRLAGRKLPALGMLIGLSTFVLLAVNRSVWTLYLLWPAMALSWGLIFPSLTGWMRYGRSGRNLRSMLFLYSFAWMSGITFGAFLGSRLYGLSAGDEGARYVYLAAIGIQLVCLALLLLPGRSSDMRKGKIHKDDPEQVDSNLASAFMQVGWIGNTLIMLFGVVLLNLFNKVATDLQFSPEVHGWLVVVYRSSAVITAGLMFLSLFWHYRWWSFLVAEGLAVVGLCLIGVTNDYWLFMLGFVLVGLMLGHNYYAGVYYSLVGVSSSDATGQRGRAALNESFFSVGSIAGAGLGGLIAWYSVRLPYFLVGGIGVAALVVQMYILRKSRAVPPAVEEAAAR